MRYSSAVIDGALPEISSEPSFFKFPLKLLSSFENKVAKYRYYISELLVLALEVSWKFQFSSLEIELPQSKVLGRFSFQQPLKSYEPIPCCWSFSIPVFFYNPWTNQKACNFRICGGRGYRKSPAVWNCLNISFLTSRWIAIFF